MELANENFNKRKSLLKLQRKDPRLYCSRHLKVLAGGGRPIAVQAYPKRVLAKAESNATAFCMRAEGMPVQLLHRDTSTHDILKLPSIKKIISRSAGTGT